MYKLLLFAGTTEGRSLAAFLAAQGERVQVTACVATDYGETRLPPAENLTVRAGRLAPPEMEELMKAGGFDLVLDATHPYAEAVTENIAEACRKTGTPYLRVLRPDSELPEDTLFVPDIPAAVEALNRLGGGNILLTTGSKTVGEWTGVRGFPERVWARVLPMESSLAACREAGLPPAHIIAMQGPFSAELNAATLRAIGAVCLVTKDSGLTGGFPEKARAAKEAGARLLVLGRPAQREGLDLPAAGAELSRRFGFSRRSEVAVVGIGPGSREGMTLEVQAAISEAECLIGAERMLASAARQDQLTLNAIAPETIAEHIRTHREIGRFAVLMSGDTGFFSGAKKLLPLLDFCDVRVCPGLSSLSVLCARLGLSYEEAVTRSLHGRAGDISPEVRRNRLVFALVGGEDGAAELCRSLTAHGLGEVTVHVGEKLSYPGETVTSGPARELMKKRFDSLSAVLVENPAPEGPVTPGWPDETFQRGDAVPMTKSEVRAVALSKLRLPENAVCWDIGAGTGSVSLEMALLARKGRVYAIERSEDALALLRENRERLGASNLTVVPGAAPAACRDLPAPTHAFLGGSGGNLREIVALLLEKNPKVRVVATAVTLETCAELTAVMKDFPFAETEAVSLTVARDRKAGPYRLLTGQNPIFLFTLQAGEKRP